MVSVFLNVSPNNQHDLCLGLCRRTALRYTVALELLSLSAPVFDVTNWWFALEVTPFNLYFLYLGMY